MTKVVEEGLSEHAVIVYFNYGLTNLGPLREVETRLDQAIEAAGVGEYDGDEIAVSLRDGTLWMYGPDAESLYATVQPILESASFMDGARVKLRFGPPEVGVTERTCIVTHRKPSE